MKPAFMGVVSLLIVSFVAVSQDTNTRLWSPPNLPVFDPSPRPTKPTEMVSSVKLNGFPIVLEETHLQAVQQHFGAVIGHEGDASESVQWVCLTGQTEGQAWVLWTASSEIEGGEVDGFQIRRIGADVQVDPRCRNVGAAVAFAAVPKPVRVGMTERDLLKTLGQATARNRDALFFAHQHKVVIGGELYDVENDVVVLLREGKVYAVQVWKTTSWCC
jgi:hypothetical protein